LYIVIDVRDTSKLKPKNKQMKVTTEITLRNFQAWSGAVETKEIIIDSGQDEQFDSLIEELYPEGLTETNLNDILWFEDEYIFNQLGINLEM
tara:strand:+ start:2346 stop:2621 length:276 start_codon:yes stop_codon:yes gene_type:complete